MTKGIIVVDMPKDCLHCELRSVIYVDGRGYQHCGLDKDGYACERFFKEEDLVDGFVSEWCPIKPLPEKATSTTENDLIRRGDVLRFLYMIKTDRDWPKNYGTLLTIINKTWDMPVAYDLDNIVEQIKEVKETVWVADETLRPEQVCDIIHEIIEIVKGGAV